MTEQKNPPADDPEIEPDVPTDPVPEPAEDDASTAPQEDPA